MLKTFFLTIVLLFNTFILSAQQIQTHHYTMSDGLPSMSVRCMFKDSRGLLWIGTDGGICTFNGESFHVYNSSDGITASRIWSIAEDEFGNMWFGSFGNGLIKYNGKSFIKITEKEGLVDNWVRVLHYSKKENCLFVGSNNGVSILKQGKVIKTTAEIFTQKGNTITSIFDAGKYIIFTIYNKVAPIIYYPENHSFNYVSHSSALSNFETYACYISLRGDTIISYNKDLRIIRGKNVIEFNKIGQVFGITEDNKGNYWFASWGYFNNGYDGGIYKYDGNRIINYKSAFGINDHEIWSVFYDKDQDILWVLTLNDGLFKIPNRYFIEYDANFFGLNKLQINCVLSDSDNDVWIADQKHLIQLFPSDSFEIVDNHSIQELLRIVYKENKWVQLNRQVRVYLKYSDQLVDDLNFIDVVQKNPDEIFFTTKLGLFSKNKNTHQICHWAFKTIEKISFLGADSLVHGGWQFFNVIPDHKRFKCEDYEVFNDYEPTRISPITNINCFYKNRNLVWVGTWSSGLWVIEGMNFTNFNIQNDSISHDITAICSDNQDQIYFASNQGDVYLARYLNRKLKIDYKLNSSNGIYGNSISWLSYDTNGFLWIGTNLGLNRLDVKELYSNKNVSIIYFDKDEGYNGQSSKSASMDELGNLWIGSRESLIKMNVSDYNQHNPKVNSVKLKNFKINYIPYNQVFPRNDSNWVNLPTEAIHLKTNQNHIIFEFGTDNFLNPKKDIYRYKLEGNDERWSNWSHDRNAVYSNLSPGKYTFYVESKNLNTGLDAIPLKLQINIAFPIWKLWYVQLFTMILVLFVVYYLNYKRIERIKFTERQKSEYNKKIAQLEMQALQAQMNPHFIFNSINNIQYYILTNNRDVVLSYLSDFSKVVRASLENASKKMVPLHQEIDFLNSYLRLEMMRFMDKFSYTIEILNDIDVNSVWIPPMIIQTYAENSIRHGFMKKTAKGKLLITFELVAIDILKCVVLDDGVGLNKSDEGDSGIQKPDRPHSSELNESRLQLFNTTKDINKYKVIITNLGDMNGNSTGVRVELFLPMENR